MSIRGRRRRRVQRAPLTEKQQRVSELLVLGLSAKQIASRLGISHRTVEAHRVQVFRKMGVRNAVELVRASFSMKEEIDG